MYTARKFNQAEFNSAVGYLQHLNADELKEILNNEEKIEEIVKDLKQKLCKDVELEKEIIIASNRSLAEYNLSKEPQLKELRQQLLDLNSEAELIYNTVEEKHNLIKQKTSTSNVETVLALVLTAAAKMEEELEEFANKFLEGEVDVEGFLEQFTAKRKLMHLRRVKADKMSEIACRRGSGPPQPQPVRPTFYDRPAIPPPYPPYHSR